MPDTQRRLVLEFGRTPHPGAVKTRLARTEGLHEAARIYRLLAEDVHAALLRGQREGAYEVVLCLPDGEAPWLPGARHHWSQGQGNLGDRLTRCFERGSRAGASAVLCVGTDVVGITPALLERAFARLEQADIVLAATPDGGYGLIGLRGPQAAVFKDIAWSTPQVAAQTRLRARAAGLTVAELRGLRDVDVAADLEGAVPLLSILVPVLNEAPRLARNLRDLMQQARAAGGVELVVADGGSSDGSRDIARSLGAQVLRTARGRGTQLAAAAARARGRWLWTLHADARLASGAVQGALRFCLRDRHPWGFCETQVEGATQVQRGFTRLTNGRAQLLRTPYGDQGILVKRAVYEHVGGYADVPLMEDVLLARALRPYGPPGRVPARLYLDRRRWDHYGVLGATLRNAWTLARFSLLGTPAARLAAGYHRDASAANAPHGTGA